MPIPAGQGCYNCTFWDSEAGTPGPGDVGKCRYTFPDFATPNWVNVLYEDWCQFWVDAATGPAVEPEYGLASLRGSSDTGYAMAGIGSWTLIDTPFLSLGASLNWDTPSNGVLRVNYSIGSPTDQFLVNFDGIVSVAAGSNNQEIKVCLGLNGVPEPATTVRMFARQSDTATPIPLVGTRDFSNLDTVGIYIESTGSATIYDHHMVAESEGPYPQGTVASYRTRAGTRPTTVAW